MFPEIYRKHINNKDLPSITEQPCHCPCGWVGTVWDCEGDVDGDGNLGCPNCLEVVEVKV